MIAVAFDGEAIAIVLRGVAVAVTVITVTTQGTGREAEDNQLQQKICCVLPLYFYNTLMAMLENLLLLLP